MELAYNVNCTSNMTILKCNTRSANGVPFLPIGALLRDVLNTNPSFSPLGGWTTRSGLNSTQVSPWVPPMDFYESPESYTLELHIPGYSRELIDISYQDDTLTVSSKNPNVKTSEDKVSNDQAQSTQPSSVTGENSCGKTESSSQSAQPDPTSHPSEVGKASEVGNNKASLTYYVKETLSGAFSRSVSIPGMINASEIKAIYKDGVLYVTLPKAEKEKPQKIEVNVG